MPSKGYIKAWRSAFEPGHWLAPDRISPASRLHAWFDFVQLATHQDRETKDSGTLHRGELVCSLRTLGTRWRWSKDKVSRFVGELKVRTAIETVRETPSGTVYRIVNYDTYQNAPGDERDSQRDEERDSGETAARQEQEQKNKRTTARVVKRRHHLPDEWSPKESHEIRAESEGINIDREVEKFRNHAKATGRVMLDWDAAFFNWMLNSFSKSSNGTSPHHANPKARGRL